MHEYIFKEINSYTKKPNEFDKYIDKKFRMNDKVIIGKMVELDFGKDKLKIKLEDIYKIDDKEKLFCLNCNKFCAIIKVVSEV
jgi:hypothetical protein